MHIGRDAFSAAIDIAKTATCEKSQRGVVFVKENRIIGMGSNGPPQGYACVPEYCKAVCAKYAVHAEKNAMFDAMARGESLAGSRGYHVKVVNGVAVPSYDPSCIECSKDMLAAKISEFVLFNGWENNMPKFTVYDMRTFHDRSMDYHWKDFVPHIKE